MVRNNLAQIRTALANERTLLAYIRTSLSLIVAGLSFIKFFVDDSYVIIGYVFIAFGIATIFFGGRQYTKYASNIESKTKEESYEQQTNY